MNAGEKELLRHAVLECLAARHPAALPTSGIVRRVKQELDCALEVAEVGAALEVLKDMALVRSQTDEFGSSLWWCATAAGVLRIERGSGAAPAPRRD